MPDIFLYQGEPNPNDVRLTDPTVLASNAITGAGILLCAAAVLSGAGVSGSTGTGILAASAAAVAGDGTVSDPVTITGSGAIVDSASTIAGVGTSGSTGTGGLVSDAATLIGVGTSLSVGVGALAAQSATASGLAAARWVASSGLVYLAEDGTKYSTEDGLGFYSLEEIPLTAQSSQISGEGEVSGEGTREYRFAPYVPRKKLTLKKKPEPEPVPVEVTVSTALEFAEPISYALEVDTLAEAGRSVERVLDNLGELRKLVHKEMKRKKDKRRKRILALITIQ